MKLTKREHKILDFFLFMLTIILTFIAFVIFIFACTEPRKIHFKEAVETEQKVDGTLVIKPSRNEF